MQHYGFIMSRRVSKLVDLDIDEVSLVDRSANQHSLVSFSKSLRAGGVDVSEEPMPEDDLILFDETGQQVFEDELEHGEVVFNADGDEYVFVEEDVVEEIGKTHALESAAGKAARLAGRYSSGGRGPSSARESAEAFGTGGRFRTAYSDASARLFGNGAQARRRKRIAAGVAGGAGAAGIGGAGAYGYSKWNDGKSLGDSVIEELSKAVTDADRDEVIAKAMDEIEIYKAQAEEAMLWAAEEHDVRVTEAFISKAEEYNLPVAPEVLGPILKAVAEVLSEEELDILDEIFNAVGDALYDEIGYVGESSNSSVMDQVEALAGEYVGKSDYTHAQLTTSMFEANPSAYDSYLAEMGR